MVKIQWLKCLTLCQAEIRSIVNRIKTNITQFGHKLHLLSHLWLGLEWDKLCDCPLIHAKMLSMLNLTIKVDSEKSLKAFLTELNANFHFASSKDDSGIPSPIGGLLALDSAINRHKTDGDLFSTKYQKFQNFLRTALLVSAFRAVGTIARLVVNATVSNHKPQSANQLEATKKKNEAKRRELAKADHTFVNCWVEVYFDQKWVSVITLKITITRIITIIIGER